MMRTSAFGVEDNRISKADRKQKVAAGAGVGGAAGAAVGAAMGAPKRAPLLDRAARYEHMAQWHAHDAAWYANNAENWDRRDADLKPGDGQFPYRGKSAAKSREKQARNQSHASRYARNAKVLRRVSAAQIPTRAAAGAVIGGAAAGALTHRLTREKVGKADDRKRHVAGATGAGAGVGAGVGAVKVRPVLRRSSQEASSAAAHQKRADEHAREAATQQRRANAHNRNLATGERELRRAGGGAVDRSGKEFWPTNQLWDKVQWRGLVAQDRGKAAAAQQAVTESHAQAATSQRAANVSSRKAKYLRRVGVKGIGTAAGVGGAVGGGAAWAVHRARDKK